MKKTRTAAERFWLLWGQWFGTGLAPKAPGTVGSVGAVPFFWFLQQQTLPVYWGATLFTCLFGIWASQKCSEILGDKDPSSVVIDEVAGVFIAMGMVMAAPLWVWILAWVLFRVFDITKPGIIDKAQYWPPNGVGIMADDILAGIVAGAISYGVWLGANQLAPGLS